MQNRDKTLVITQKQSSSTWRKTRNVLLLQVKLWIDAIRDFALMPIGLICYLMDILSSDDNDRHWQKLMKWGRRSDHHINLFQHHSFEEKQGVTVDDVADIVEDVIKGDVKNSANTQQLVDTIRQRVKSRFTQDQ